MALTQSLGIKAAVGAQPGAANNRADVEVVQRLLNEHVTRVGYPTQPVNGLVSPQTIDAIKKFQQKVVGMKLPDGRVDPAGTTLRKLNEPAGTPTPAFRSAYTDVFSHPDAEAVKLTYGPNAVKLNAKAEYLLKSILASCGMTGATLTSTLRTYHDQARITLTQTLPNKGEATVRQWYGQSVLDACKTYKGDVEGMAKWWKEYDGKRGAVSSKHLSNLAMDVVPSGDRAKFAAKVQELKSKTGTGVLKIIPKGVMNEPVDHVEFTFPVTG
jgi:peptidoglycan hydrolase-like protein with peptidoglycan-binding domain